MRQYFILTILWLAIILIFSSCEEELPPESFTSEMHIIPINKVSYNSANIYWSEYDGDGFDSYEIYFKKFLEKDYKLYSAVKILKQTFITVYNLEPNTDYSFYIRTKDISGRTYETKPYQLSTLSDIPSPARIYNVTDATHYSVKVYYSSYLDASVVDFDRYEIYYSDAMPGFTPSKENFFQSVSSIEDTSLIVNVLGENTGYYFIVRIYNVLGKYSESNAGYAKTTFKPPDTVMLYDAIQVTETNAIIKWTKVKSKNSPVYNIRLSESPNYRNSEFIVSFPAKNDTMYRLVNLKKHKEYFAWVEVTDSRYLSSLSRMIDFTATEGGNPMPVTLTNGLADRTSISLSWSASLSNYPTTNPYDILVSKVPNTNPRLMQVYASTGLTSYQIKKREPNTTYYFRIMFTNRFGKSSYSNEINVTTLP